MQLMQSRVEQGLAQRLFSYELCVAMRELQATKTSPALGSEDEHTQEKLMDSLISNEPLDSAQIKLIPGRLLS
jgi:hypothetical protein